MRLSPFTKQLFIAGSPILAGLSVGGAVTFPMVLLHQLKAKDSPIQLDFDTASWIDNGTEPFVRKSDSHLAGLFFVSLLNIISLGAIHGLSGLPSILIPSIMQWAGRKSAFIAACLISIAGWILAYFAETATSVLVSESFHGLGSNSVYAVTSLTITEMIAPKYRDSFIQMYYASETVAMTLNGLMVQWLHWKTISIIMVIPMILAVAITCAWPESPYWLALKGRFEECERTFLWLRGDDDNSKNELNDLLHSQNERLRSQAADTSSISCFWHLIIRRDFYVPCMHVFVLQYLVHGSGSIIIIIYSIEMIQKTTTNEKLIFLSSFIVNIILLVGFVVSVVTNKYFRRKSVLLLSIIGAVVSLVSASGVSYAQSVGWVAKDSLACFYSLIAYLISSSLGIMSTAYPIASALMPVKHKGIGGILYVATTCVLHTAALKVAPYLFLYINMWGTFLLFAVNCICCGLIIWKFVPETKGRTLQDIENYYTHGKFTTSRKLSEHLEPMI